MIADISQALNSRVIGLSVGCEHAAQLKRIFQQPYRTVVRQLDIYRLLFYSDDIASSAMNSKLAKDLTSVTPVHSDKMLGCSGYTALIESQSWEYIL
jgi:hypothetical protein